ncbi:MAG: hypothetical protein A2W27_03560 [Deltaproteobacteria bacterium RBG_16_44_11]|nr:MAG: hypothetical protein A2W27_03560 [Deltaproteobacteria bacterium RBG_16_44_11]
MDYLQMTGPCGIDCFNCVLYLANSNKKLRKAVAEKMQLPEHEAVCNGCRAHGGIIPALKRTEPCQVFQCISQKGFKFCFECSDFPCDRLHLYADMASQRPLNTKVFNLCLIKKLGIEKWALQKAKSVRETYFKEKFHL